MLNKFLSWFKPKPCASCQAKSEQIEYLQKLIDQLLIKNGFNGLSAHEVIETASQKRRRELEEKEEDEKTKLLLDGGVIYGGDD